MFEGQERLLISNDWITIILVIVLLLIAIVKYTYSERFTKLFTLLYSDKYYTDYSKSKPLIFSTFHAIFFFISIFSISLLIYFYFDSFEHQLIDRSEIFYLKILFGVILYIIIRFVIGLFLSEIFEAKEDQKYFTFLKISNLSLFSVYLYILLVLINYTPISYNRFIYIIGILLLFILILSRYYSMLKNSKINFINLFYLFLYLCALEITPFIVVYKLFVI